MSHQMLFICPHHHGSTKLYTYAYTTHQEKKRCTQTVDNYVLAALSTLSLMPIYNFITHTAHKDQFTLSCDLLPESLDTIHISNTKQAYAYNVSTLNTRRYTPFIPTTSIQLLQ